MIIYEMMYHVFVVKVLIGRMTKQQGGKIYMKLYMIMMYDVVE